MLNPNNVVAVVVTYLNRFNLLKQVIDSLLEENVKRIIVVDNGSDKESYDKLEALSLALDGILKVCRFEDNLGSANGFSFGIQQAYKEDAEYVWLLDDDNKPRKGALNALLKFWNENNPNPSETITISLRLDRQQYIDSILYNDKDILLGKKNSFMTFDVLNYFKKRLNKSKKKFDLNNLQYAEVGQAPYGGMFFHKCIVDNIGYPNKDFFVYTDDTEFSYRIIKQNGKIYAIIDSILDDIDTSWSNITNKNIFMYHPILDSESDFRIYYSFRNRVFFELRERVSNKVFYIINMLFFMLNLLFKAILKKKIKRYKLVILAIRDGIVGKLGKYEK